MLTSQQGIKSNVLKMTMTMLWCTSGHIRQYWIRTKSIKKKLR